MHAKPILLWSLILLWGVKTTFAGNAMDLIIPTFEVRSATIEEALTQLRQWGVLISLEKLPSARQPKISVQLNGASITEVLDAIVKADDQYSWELYGSRLNPASRLRIVNVLPREARRNPTNLMNIRFEALELTRVVPDKAITGIHLLIPELNRRYWELVEPGGVVSGLGSPSERFFLSLKLEDKTVREALNEISIRSGFGWIYEPSLSPPRHVWRVFW